MRCCERAKEVSPPPAPGLTASSLAEKTKLLLVEADGVDQREDLLGNVAHEIHAGNAADQEECRGLRAPCLRVVLENGSENGRTSVAYLASSIWIGVVRGILRRASTTSCVAKGRGGAAVDEWPVLVLFRFVLQQTLMRSRLSSVLAPSSIWIPGMRDGVSKKPPSKQTTTPFPSPRNDRPENTTMSGLNFVVSAPKKRSGARRALVLVAWTKD